ncbi:MAG: HAD hydrolase family protein [Candidatus Omnitrophota bacterium]|jgi:YrbI family 3-deoxy-D-manno-octulosonate 8-phosphate phosphatase
MKIKKETFELARKVKIVVFDFDGVFTDNRVLVSEDGKESVFCSRGDGHGIKLLKEAGVETLVISTEVNPVVSARCKKLNLRCIQGCENKIKVLARELKRLNIKPKEAAYLGNDVNDLECLETVGLSACVADATYKILKICRYRTKACGGFGAVREFCDFIIEAKG